LRLLWSISAAHLDVPSLDLGRVNRPKAFGDSRPSLVELPAPVTKNPPACSFVSTKGQIGRLDKARSQRSTARWLGRHYGPNNIPCTTGY